MPDSSSRDPLTAKIPPVSSTEHRWERRGERSGACDLFPDGGWVHLQLGQGCSPYDEPAPFLVHLVDSLTTATWHSLLHMVDVMFGAQSTLFGILYGLGESGAKDIGNLLGLAKILVFGTLYATLHEPVHYQANDELVRGLAFGLDKIPWMHHEMSTAFERMVEFIEDLKKIARYPKDFFDLTRQDMKQAWTKEWDAFRFYFEHPGLTHNFQLGRQVGHVFYQIVSAALLVRESVALAGELPKLARVANLIARGGRFEYMLEPERLAARGGGMIEELKGVPKTESAPKPAIEAAAEPEGPVFKAKLRGKEVELPGVETVRFYYTKRLRSEYEAYVSKFRPAKRQFLKEISTNQEYVDQLKDAGLTDDDLALMQNGRNPDGWEVHHRYPLDDNGTNDFSNLILTRRDPEHQSFTNVQTELTSGMQPEETRSVDFPMPPGDSIVYPQTP